MKKAVKQNYSLTLIAPSFPRENTGLKVCHQFSITNLKEIDDVQQSF